MDRSGSCVLWAFSLMRGGKRGNCQVAIRVPCAETWIFVGSLRSRQWATLALTCYITC